MELETVFKIEGYSVESQEENDNGQTHSDEIKSAVSVTPVPLLPGPCGFQNYDSTSPTAIAFHPEIASASNNYTQIINAGKSPLTKTKDVKEAISRKEQASAEGKFRCSIPNCPKSFPDKWELKTHLISHSTARPHHCNVCSTSYKYIKDLRIHERKVHQLTHKAKSKSGLKKQAPLQRSESAKIVMLVPTPISILPIINPSFSFGAVVPSEDVDLCSKPPTEKSSQLVNHESDPLKQPGKTKSMEADRRKGEAFPEEKYEKCPIPNCSNIFTNQWKLDAHLRNRHGQNWLFKCQLCELICLNKSDLEKHLINHFIARPHNCNLCSESFKYNTHLRQHQRAVHQITQKAPQKSRSQEQLTFQRSESAKIVMRRETPRPILPKTPLPVSFEAVPFRNVLLCSKSSLEKISQLVNHEPDQLLKTQPQISIATTTTVNFPDSTNVTEGELVDLTTAPEAPPLLKVNPTNKCDVCLKSFKSRGVLAKHRSQVHTAENEKQYKCHICLQLQPCVVKRELKLHLYFVHGEKSEDLKIFECEFCQRQFPSVSRLELHVVDKHVVDKEFECSVCSKTFVDQDALTKHQVKIHEQTTILHVCDVCLAGFTSGKNLVIHLKNVHKKLYCHKCKRSFKNKSELNQHLNSDATNNLKAGLKFQCQVCSVSLSTQCNFSIHSDVHAEENKSTV